MNYDKIGKFIAKKRKEKNMTQNDLAKELKLTDRAISRWERGVGCPDISLLEPLSKILETSVLELLHGEELQNNENEIILDIIKKDNKTIKNWKIIALTFINLLLILLIFLFTCSYTIPRKIEKGNQNINVVISPSMEPTLKIYDTVISKKININKIKVGDIIVYRVPDSIYANTPIIHRVTKIENIPQEICITTDGNNNNNCNDINLENICLITKGDANSNEDIDCITQKNLIGKVTTKIPYIGRFILKNTKPSIPFIMFLMLGILSIIFIDIIQVINYVRKR